MLYFHNHDTDNQTTITPRPGETEREAAQRVATENGHGVLHWTPATEPEQLEAGITETAYQSNGETAGEYTRAQDYTADE